MINKVIGIISYLPNDIVIRKHRLSKLIKLIKKCDQLFNLPIIIVAQNYESQELTSISFSKNILIYKYSKLGIVGARNTLRKIFLESNYDYLIMIDDDSSLDGTSGKKYLQQIDSHPEGFGEFKKSLLKLFAISKYLFQQISFDEGCNPEKGEGFEDRLFVNTLRKKFPDRRFEFEKTGISEFSISTADPDTTWYDNQNLTKMLSNTQNKIDNIR